MAEVLSKVVFIDMRTNEVIVVVVPEQVANEIKVTLQKEKQY